MMHMRTALVIAAVGLVGCHPSAKKTHNAAKEHWNSTRSSVVYSLAKNQFESGDLDKAEKTIVEAIQTSPEKAEHYELAARIQIERGRLERAYNLLEEGMSHNAKRADSHYLLGVIYERWQRYEPALAAYEKAYELRPDDVGGLLAAAEMLVKLDRLDEAVRRLEEKASYFENNAALRVELGQMHAMRGEYGRAVRCFRQASLLNPEDPSITEYLALAQCANGEHRDAVEPLRTLLANPKNADRDDLRMVLGDCYIALKRPVEARHLFLELTRRNPSDVTGWIKLGGAALVVGDSVRVNESAERIVALAPDRPEGHVLRGMAEQKAGRHEQAAAAFDRAARLSPDSAAPLLLKGVSLERIGDRSAAADAYRQALQIDPADERTQRLLAGVEAR